MSTLEEEEKRCKCCTKHVPLPLSYIVVDSIYLCPTAHANMLMLQLEYDAHNGRPPGHIRKHFSDYIQKMVQSMYDRENS